MAIVTVYDVCYGLGGRDVEADLNNIREVNIKEMDESTGVQTVIDHFVENEHSAEIAQLLNENVIS